MNDPDPLGDPPVILGPIGGSAGPAPARPKRLECDFCKCILAPSGDVLSMSAEARVFRDLREENIKLEAKLADLQRQLAEARQAPVTPAAPAAPVNPARGHLHATS